MDVAKLSKYRKECMGLSILFIMLCHSRLAFANPRWEALYAVARPMGQVGVDMFFLLSGLGLYMSFRRTPKLLTFYRKRFSRIVPTFFVVVVPYVILSTAWNFRPLSHSLFYYSVITFYSYGALTEWFVAAILTLYILFPLLYLLLERSEKWAWILMGGSVLISAAIAAYTVKHPQTTVGIINEVFLVRLSPFLAGAWLGKQLADGKTKICRTSLMIPIFIVSLAACIVNIKFNTVCMWWSQRLMFFPLAFSGLALVSAVLDRFALPRQKTVLAFLGGYTFEIYLWQEKVQDIQRIIGPWNPNVKSPGLGAVMLCFGCLSATVILAVLTSLFVDWMMSGFGIPDRLKRRKLKNG